MPHSTSLVDLPLDVMQLILAAAVDGLLTDDLVIGAPCRHQFEGRRKLQFYLHLRVVCRRWRKLLDSMPLHVRHLHLVPQAPLCHVSMPPLQVGQLHVAGGPENPQPIIESMAALLASTTFCLHSAAGLRSIKSPAFTLSADSAAAFPQLECIQRLDAQTVPPQLPPSLKRLWLVGDPWQLTRLAPDVFSDLPQLEVLVLHSVTVDVEQLPRSLWSLDVFNVEPGPTLNRALQTAARRLPAEDMSQIWTAHHDGRHVMAECTLIPDWDSRGRFVIRDIEVGRCTANSVQRRASNCPELEGCCHLYVCE